MDLTLLRAYLSSQEFDRKMSHRIERLQEAEMNPVARYAMFQDCREDVFTFIDLFGVVYEPRLSENPDIPMFLFPHQREIIERLIRAENNGEDLFIEKTRDMMATWTVLWYMMWRWRFKDKWYGLVGSRKEEEVDDKTPQSLFGRLRYMLYAMPSWMRPQRFRKSEHDLHMKLINPEMTSYLDGESANPDFARGSRSAFMLLDELFFWRFARESWRACTDSSPCRIAISTAKPSSFARHFSDSFGDQGRKLTLDWHEHPFKNEAWYKREQERRAVDPLSTAGELNISYEADPETAYYPETNLCDVKEFEYDPSKPLYIGCDFGSQDKTAFVYVQRDTERFYVIDAIEKRQKPLYWYYPFLKHGYDFSLVDSYEIENKFTREKFTIRKKDYLQDELDLIKRFNSWKLPVMYCGEVAHRQHMIKSNTSIATELAGIGVFLRINDMAVSHSVRRTATKKMLNKTTFSSSYGGLDVYDACINSRFVTGRDNSSSIEGKDKPIHDEFADLRSALENFAVNITIEGAKVREFQYRKLPPNR